MLEAASWWAAVQALGLIALPLSVKVFKSLPDRGYAFSKILGLLLFSYVIWLLASTHVLPNRRLTIIFFLLAFAAAFAAWTWLRPSEIRDQLKSKFNVILTTELIFAAAFALWALVRAYAPAITATEKPMDFAFLNSILRADYFPPPDPWLTGFSLNNYYFGHFIVALLTKLTGVSAGIGFNLGVALLFALVAVGVFSLTYNLVAKSEGEGKHRKAIAFGILGVVLLLIVSNLEGILEFFYSRGMASPAFFQWFEIKGLAQPYVSDKWYPTEYWFFWRASRIIDTVVGGASLDYTITEFPFFSFLLADLHAHVLALPFTLLALGFSMNVLFTRESMGFAWLRRNVWVMVAVMIALGALGAIHSWDLPTYVGIFVVAIFVQSYLVPSPGRRWIAPAAISAIVLIGVFFYFLPYYSAFKAPVTGVLPWLGPGTRPVYWLVLYGLFALITVPVTIMEAKALRPMGRTPSKMLALLAPILLGPLVIWTLLMIVIGSPVPASLAIAVSTRWRNLIPILLLILLALWVVMAKSKKIKEHSPWGLSGLYTTLLVLGAALLIYATDLFYVRDVLFGNRMNTIFRFHYQAWVFLSIAAAYGAYYICAKRWNLSLAWKIPLFAWLGIIGLLLLGSLFYPVAATFNYFNFQAKPTLDGQAFLSQSDKQAVAWLQNNAPEGAVIAEAFGGDYTDAGRISQRTGIPTIVEWAEHQKIWRGSDKDFAGRPQDVDTIYRSDNPAQVLSLLAKYRVTFIYVGDFERQQYGDQVMTRFNSIADVAFRNQSATIYRSRSQ